MVEKKQKLNSKLRYLESLNAKAMGFNPILNTTYKRDKNNKAILWKTSKDEYLNKAKDYYNEYPTLYNKENVNNFTKALTIARKLRRVPFGQGCIGTVMKLTGNGDYISNQAFYKDPDNGR